MKPRPKPKPRKAPAVPVCTPVALPEDQVIQAAAVAVQENPANAPNLAGLLTAFQPARGVMEPAAIAVLTTKYWRSSGVTLSVSFMDGGPADLRKRILEHFNAWGAFANVKFAETTSGGQVRVSRGRGGYYSYLGTDILSIPANQHTMNLEGFTMQTSEREFKRVVRHEVGHTLGCPHEHMRASIIARLDVRKTIDYFRRTQGWSEQQTRQQVLTPLSEASILGTTEADDESIMTYQLPASITKDGRPVPGGYDFSRPDKEFVGRLWPLAVQPPPPPTGDKQTFTLEADWAARTLRLVG
jgi:hypothetical protein